MNMIERVAKAINEALLQHGDYKPDELARAAIAAMREPTDRMVHVGTMNNLRQDGFFMGEIWKNMIDAALEEK